MDSRRLVSWPMAFCVRHSGVSIPGRLTQSAAQQGGRAIRPCKLHNLESVRVGRIAYRHCRWLFGPPAVAW
jgi:hypothetical protein